MKENNNQSLDKLEGFNITKTQWLWFTVSGAVLLSLSFYLWFQVDIDKSVLFSLNYVNFNNFVTRGSKIASKYGMSAIAVIYLFYLIGSIRNPQRSLNGQIYLLIIFSFAVSGISGDLLKELLDRTRPIHEYASELSGLTSSKSPSFPSGHATKSMALLLPFLFFTKWSGSFRVLLKVILSFVVLLVGFCWAMLGLPLAIIPTNFILHKMTADKFEKAKKIWFFVYIGLIVFLVLL